VEEEGLVALVAGDKRSLQRGGLGSDGMQGRRLRRTAGKISHSR